MAAKVVCTTVAARLLDLIRILFIYFSVPATCVRICMLFCSAASGSLYSPAFPVSTSSSLTFTWFSRSRNNLQSHGEISLNNRRLRHQKKRRIKCWIPFSPASKITSLSAPGIVSPDPSSHPDILLFSSRSLHHPSLHRTKRKKKTV